jgi:tetratricopeptide (TPR) repeat protein
MFSSLRSSTGDAFLKRFLTLCLFILLAGRSFGQQDQPSDLASLLAAAQQAQASSNYTAAIADYEQATKLRPDIPELQANLGLMQHEAGHYPEAIQSFEKALRLKPSLYVPTLFLGVDYVQTGKAKEAIPLLVKAEKINAADPLPSVTLGRAYSSLGEYGPAIREFRRSLLINPKQGSAWFDMGIAELDQVEEDSRTMTSKYADSSYAKALFAESLVKQSRYNQAADLYKNILAANDQPPCMRSEAGFLDLKQGNAQNAELQFKTERSQHPECELAVLGEARLSMDAGLYQDALQLLHQLWTSDQGFLGANAPQLIDGVSPEHMTSFLNTIVQQQSLGNGESEFYVRLTQMMRTSPSPREEATAAQPSPALPKAQNNAREAYLAGHYGRCATMLKSSLRTANAAGLGTLAACSFFAGEYALTSDAARALESLPSHSEAHALYWSIQANEKLAFESLDRFQAIEPNSARSHILLGDIYRQRERYDDAQKEYAKGLALSPNDLAALLGLASAYYGNANVAKTIEIAHQALQLSPDDPEINLLMGEALSSQHRFTDAEPYLLKALNAKPQMLPHVHALLGEAYASDGKTQDAIRELKLGAESDQDGSVHYQLARLYNKIGDRADAAAAMQQMKVLQQRRRDGAVIAIEDSHPAGLEGQP